MKIKDMIAILQRLDQEKDIYLTNDETGEPYDPPVIISYDEKAEAYTID